MKIVNQFYKVIFYRYCLAYRHSEKHDLRGMPDIGAFWIMWLELNLLLVTISGIIFNSIKFENKYVFFFFLNMILSSVLIKKTTKKFGKIPPKDFVVKFNFKYYLNLILYGLILIYLAVNLGFSLLSN